MAVYYSEELSIDTNNLIYLLEGLLTLQLGYNSDFKVRSATRSYFKFLLPRPFLCTVGKKTCMIFVAVFLWSHFVTLVKFGTKRKKSFLFVV